MAAGRPTSYKEDYNEQAYKLCLLGATDGFLAYFFNVPVLDIEEWINSIERFRNSILKAQEDYPEYLRKKEERKERRRQYRKQDHIKKSSNEYIKYRLKTDSHLRIRFNVSSIMRSRLRSKNSVGIFRHIGYTVQELRNHLESKFTDGMTWDNYGKVWHIDHIKPDCLFKYTSVNDKEFKEAWALNNLQPLFAIDNLKKGKKYAG